MQMTLTMEDFHALLTSEKDDTPLLTALRKLTSIKKPEEITELRAGTEEVWVGWGG